MAVAFGNFRFAVERRCAAALRQHARICAEAHRAALLGDGLLFGHDINDGMLGKLIEFRRMRILPAQHVPRELDHGDLHTEADAEIGDLMRAGVLCGDDHALNAAVAEAAGHENARAAAEDSFRIFLREL